MDVVRYAIRIRCVVDDVFTNFHLEKSMLNSQLMFLLFPLIFYRNNDDHNKRLLVARVHFLVH
jgi:hypothetical protein